jgi:hypothetical protein
LSLKADDGIVVRGGKEEVGEVRRRKRKVVR